ncbi:hypothetical protein KW783_03520, partial [Candidatus Parcubacteria bacterium]|nr:hypothetical protein [Candidatus Parcubacteria bacterium]
GIYQITFRVSSSSGSSSSVRVDNFNIYEFSDSGFSNPVGGLQTDGAFLATSYAGAWSAGTADITIGAQTAALASTTAVVPAGTDRYFAIRGDVTVSGTGNSVSTILMGDAKFASDLTSGAMVLPGQASTTFLATTTFLNNIARTLDNDFIWRPFSTTTTQSATANDYSTGYGVPGLPTVQTNGQTIAN